MSSLLLRMKQHVHLAATFFTDIVDLRRAVDVNINAGVLVVILSRSAISIAWVVNNTIHAAILCVMNDTGFHIERQSFKSDSLH